MIGTASGIHIRLHRGQKDIEPEVHRPSVREACSTNEGAYLECVPAGCGRPLEAPFGKTLVILREQ